jgi:Domain of unknown function (DUF4145)
VDIINNTLGSIIQPDLASYDAPSFKSEGFNCPFCGAFAHQVWSKAAAEYNAHDIVPDTYFAQCMKCKNYSIWHGEQLIHPSGGNAPLPHADLPEDLKKDYEEARSIVSRSPRSAAALLRLTIEKLTNTILEENKNKSLNSKIELLVEKKVLRSEIGKALHVVRVIGNNAVPNPAEIDLRDDIEIAVKLFKLVNMIVQETITESREIDSIIHNLPNGAKKSIEKRNVNMVPKGNQLDE